MALNQPDRDRIAKEAKEAEIKIKFSSSGGSVLLPGGYKYTDASSASKKIKGS